jgi:hypothetical protein
LFNEESVHDFIHEYASKKAWYLLNGERLIQRTNNEDLIYRDEALNCLWEIQQLKLFRLQISWRAGLIEIPGIEVSYDFNCWEHVISRCPFLDPVSETELLIYTDYLKSESYAPKSWPYGWQDYEMYRSQNNSKDITPAWYRFSRDKIEILNPDLLPDLKGTEERYYIALWENHNENVKSFGYAEQGKQLPDLYLNFETMDFFISTFENRKLYNYFESFESKSVSAHEENMFQESLRILNRSTDKISLPSCDNWRDAVIAGANIYKKKKILEHLPSVYEDYKFRVESGITFSTHNDKRKYQEQLDYALSYRNTVEQGKKLAGL